MKRFLAAVIAIACALVPATAFAANVPSIQTNTLGYTAVEYTDLGAQATSTVLRIVVGLEPRNAAELPQLVAAVSTPGNPMYGATLSPAQTTATFGQSSAAIASVESYLASNGFTGIAASPDGLLVGATGTVGDAETAFGTKIDAIRAAGVTTFANVTPAYVPPTLGGLVVAVEGLSPAAMHPDARPATGSAAPLSAAAVQALYDARGTASASRTTLAVIAAGNLAGLPPDLARYASANGLPETALSIVPTGAASSDASLLPEWDLDGEAALGLAGAAARLVVYDAPSLAEGDVTAALSRFESDGTAQAALVSFGICEAVPETDGAMLVDDRLLALAALHGQSLFAATGDKLDGCPSRQYPASSPYATAVGGTTPVAATATAAAGEVAWSLTDGGPSAVESAPFWQAGIAPAAAAQAKLRAVPDLVLDGDPSTGLLAIVNGTSVAAGGTSLAAALALGAWGRLESAHGNALGFASARLYREYGDLRTAADAVPAAGAIEQPIGGFRDLLVGTSSLPAGPEDDFATGLGSLDVGLQILDVTR